MSNFLSAVGAVWDAGGKYKDVTGYNGKQFTYDNLNDRIGHLADEIKIK